MQKGGRKIKRSKSLYKSRRRRRTSKIITAIIMLIIIAGLIFLGYSVGEPILNFFSNKNDNQSSSSEPWSPSDISSSDSQSSSSESDSSSESKPDSGNSNSDDFSALELTAENLLNEASLTAAIDNAKLQGCTALVVTLKSSGGAVNYKSNVELANRASAITSELTSARIAEIIKNSELTSIARVSMLNDNITPKADKTTGYSIEGSDSAWYDNSPQKGGKPWLNPFSETTKKFMSDISSEVCLAGFDEVICSDVIFPPFRDTDLNYIGASVKDQNRYTALINVVDIFKNNAGNTETKIGLEVSAKGIIDSTAEVFKPAMLEGINAVVDYNVSEIGNKLVVDNNEIILTDLSVYDKAKAVFENVKVKSGNMELIPCIDQEGMNVGDVSEAVRAIVDLGYKKYIVK